MFKRLLLLFMAYPESVQCQSHHENEHTQLHDFSKNALETQELPAQPLQNKTAPHFCCSKQLFSKQELGHIEKRISYLNHFAFFYIPPQSEALFDPLIDPPIRS